MEVGTFMLFPILSGRLFTKWSAAAPAEPLSSGWALLIDLFLEADLVPHAATSGTKRHWKLELMKQKTGKKYSKNEGEVSTQNVGHHPLQNSLKLLWVTLVHMISSEFL